MKHFLLLRQTTTDEKTAAYLDELIGENEKIRPVVQSGNEMMNLILNSKLSGAAGAGIDVEILRMQVPDKLPLSDREPSSLMMNLFVFICENGATSDWIHKETAPEHGLGLKVVRQIVERYGNLSDTEHGEDYYKVTVLLPFHQSFK